MSQHNKAQRLAFVKWANLRLTEGEQAARLTVEGLEAELAGADILEMLLLILSGDPAGHIPGVKRGSTHYLQIGANLQCIWEWMEKEHIDLTGITSLSIRQGVNERSCLALLWRLILKYDMAATIDGDCVYDSLLEWVIPHCKPHKQIRNFEGSWKDGLGFLALLHSLAAHHVQAD